MLNAGIFLKAEPTTCGGEISVCFVSLCVSSMGMIMTDESLQHMARWAGEKKPDEDKSTITKINISQVCAAG